MMIVLGCSHKFSTGHTIVASMVFPQIMWHKSVHNILGERRNFVTATHAHSFLDAVPHSLPSYNNFTIKKLPEVV